MTSELRDPGLPAGAVDGATGKGIRNDGKRLKPAAKNPWYVLATIAGEQKEFKFDKELHARNRRYWNGWACSQMSDTKRKELAERLGLPVEELAPWTQKECATVKAALSKRLGGKVAIPDPSKTVDFQDTHFSYIAGFRKCVVAGPAHFQSATFSRVAHFQSATFSRVAYFESATFSGRAYFESATFSDRANFQFATFGGHADFRSATFSDRAYFRSATFSRHADFRSTQFSGPASFRSATFRGGGRLRFREVQRGCQFFRWGVRRQDRLCRHAVRGRGAAILSAQVPPGHGVYHQARVLARGQP